MLHYPANETQKTLTARDVNWVQHLVLRIGLLQRISNGKTESYSIVTQQQWEFEMELPFLLRDEGQSKFWISSWKSSVIFGHLRQTSEILK